jgi:hypothetical protein
MGLLLTVLDFVHFALYTSNAADLIWVVCAVVLQASHINPRLSNAPTALNLSNQAKLHKLN